MIPNLLMAIAFGWCALWLTCFAQSAPVGLVNGNAALVAVLLLEASGL